MIRFFDLNKKSKDLLRKTGALVSVGAVLFTMSSCSKKAKPSVGEPTTYNVVMDEMNEEKDTCVLFNVGNFTTKGISNIRKLKKANKKDITSGVIINTIASTKGEIFKDAEYAKYLVANADVDYPVYLDIEGLYNNEKLTIDEVLDLISAFCSKLTANNIFVGVCGDEASLQRLSLDDKNGILEAYDVLALNDDPEIELKNTNSVIKVDENDNLYTENNIKEVIETSGLNDPEYFSNDLLYELKDGESLNDVARLYDLSVEDLIIYNNIDRKKIDEVTKLRIPTRYSKIATVIDKDSNEPLLGIDISYAQGEDKEADWNKINENYDFVIIRANIGSRADQYYEKLSALCEKHKIPMGAYCYQKEISDKLPLDEFKEAVKEEVKVFLDTIEGKKISTPVYLDLERDEYYNINFDLPSEYLDFLLDYWYDTIKEQGYTPGIYTGRYIYRDIIAPRYNNDLERFSLWISGNNPKFKEYDIKYSVPNGDNRPVTIEEINKVVPTINKEDLNYPEYIDQDVDIIQFTDLCINSGIGTPKGYVDVNLAFKENILNAVEGEISKEDMDLLRTMEPRQFTKLWNDFRDTVDSDEFKMGTGYGVASTLLIIAMIRRIIENLRRRRAMARTRERQNENTQ